MAHLFISYAREDAAFTRELGSVLEAAGSTVWMDTVDILPATQWRKEIADAILAAQAVVAVLSRASIASAACRAELDHAFSLNKRVIPILLQDLGDGPVDQRLVELNWLSAEGVSLGDLGSRVVAAAEADFDWLKTHTRLLVRAHEWLDAKRDRSNVLRGRELREAENWLKSAAGRTPPATDQHKDFILASRQAAFRSLLTITATTAALALIAVAGAWIALVQRGAARTQATVAYSGRLSAEARLMIGLWPHRATLLAAESVAALGDADEMARDSAEQALRDVLGSVGGTPVPAAGPTVRRLGFDRKNHLYVVGPDGWGKNPSLQVINLASPSGGPRVLAGPERRVIALAFDLVGGHVAAGGKDGKVEVWTQAAERSVRVMEQPGWVGALAFLNGGGLLVTGTSRHFDGKMVSKKEEFECCALRLWSLDEKSGAKDGLLWHGPLSVVAAAASPYGPLVAASTDDGVLRIWRLDQSTTEPALTIAHPDQESRSSGLFSLIDDRDSTDRIPDWRPHFERLVVSKFGHWLVAEGYGYLQIIPLDPMPSPLPPIKIWASRPPTLTVSPNEDWLAVGLGSGEIHLYRLKKPAPQARLLRAHEPDAAVRGLAFSEDSRWLVSGGSDRTVRLFDMRFDRNEPVATLRGHEADVNDVAIDASATIVSGDRDGKIRRWPLDFGTGSIEPWSPPLVRGDVTSSSFLPDGRTALFGTQGGGVARVTLGGQAANDPLWAAPIGLSAHVAVSRDGSRVAALETGGTLRVWSLQREGLSKQHTEVDLPGGMVWRLAFAGAGPRVVALIKGRNGDEPYVVDPGRRQAWVLQKDQPTSAPLAFRTAGDKGALQPPPPAGAPTTAATAARLAAEAHRAAADSRRALGEFQAAMRREQASPTQPPASGIKGLLVADDGSAVTVLNDGRLRGWALSEPGPVRLTWSDDTVRDLTAWALSGDGRSLAVGSRKGEVDRFAVEPDRLRAVGRVTDLKVVTAALAFDRAGNTLATSSHYRDHVVRLFDLRRDPPSLVELRGHDADVNALALSADGQRLVTSDGKRFLLWRHRGAGWAAPIELVAPSRRNAGPAWSAGHSLAFSPDGRWFAVSRINHEVYLWRVDAAELLNAACAVAARTLSQDERMRYLDSRGPLACR